MSLRRVFLLGAAALASVAALVAIVTVLTGSFGDTEGKIFATLGYPDASWAMVSLRPVDQDLFIQADPLAFVPVKGAWGKQGATNVRLGKATKALVKSALESACRYRIEKTAATAPRGGRRAVPPASSAGARQAATTSRRSRPPATPSRRRR